MTTRRAIALAGAALAVVLVAGAAVFVAARASRSRQPTHVVVTLGSRGANAVDMDHEAVAVERQLVSRSFASLTSVSAEGTACVAAELDPKDDPLDASHRAREALESCRASGSANDAQVVTIVAPTQEVHAALAADAMSLVELRRLAWRVASETLQRTPGVRDVEICGGADEEIAIRLDPSTMAARGIGVADVTPDVRGARSPEDVGALPIATRNGAPVLVRDVATVSRAGVAPRCAAATDEGRGRVILAIQVAWPSDRELATARGALVRAIGDAARTLPAGVRLEAIDAADTAADTRALRAKLYVTGVDVPPGASMESTLRLAQTLAGPGVDRVWLLARPKHASCIEPDAPTATAIVRAAPNAAADAIRAALAARLPPGAALRRVRRIDDPPAVSRAWIYAPSWEEAQRVAERARGVVAAVPGVTDVGAPPARGEPRIAVDPSRAAIARVGLSASDVARAARVALAGDEIGSVRGPDGGVPVVVRSAAGAQAIDALARLPLRAGDGRVVPMSEVVTVRAEEGSGVLVRRKLSPASFVRFFAPTRRVLDAVRARLAKDLALPAGVVLEVDGVTP